jgi:hypothetical protein
MTEPMKTDEMFPTSGVPADQPVECLGQTFPSDTARRDHYLTRLRVALEELNAQLGGVTWTSVDDTVTRLSSLEHWQLGDGDRLRELVERMREAARGQGRGKDLLQLWKDEVGFPHGEMDDILRLSDPPYYTACPNPFIGEFIAYYGKPYDLATSSYHREPFAADVSEGKNDPIYNAHGYHTKVPHKAIMRYILHYTKPGDIVFDGFCGTGMAGVAAQLCEDEAAITDLGYMVLADGTILGEGNAIIGQKGRRPAIVNDLSPAATLIAAGYNLTSHGSAFARTARNLLNTFNQDYGWLYQTIDPATGKTCQIDYTVWSEVFACPQCSGELVFWDLAYDEETGKVSGDPICPHCGTQLSKRELIRKTTTFFDTALRTTRERQILYAVEIHYQIGKSRLVKKPDENDIRVLNEAENLLKGLTYPVEQMMFVDDGNEWGDLYRGYHSGINRVHDFYLPRQLAAYSILWQLGERFDSEEMKRLWRFLLQSIAVSFTRRNRFLKNAFSQVNRGLSGTLYLGSTVSEPSPEYCLTGKLRRFDKAIPTTNKAIAIQTQSFSVTGIPTNSIDYIFVDPPFGDNLPYTELNFLWEAWLQVFSNARQDNTVSTAQGKDIATYTAMMTASLREAYRILKPGHWITVEFHNSKNAVWAAIQEAMGRAGFIVADVSVLDKGMRTKKQLNANAVDKDLVISAYKPNGGLEERFRVEAGTENGVWDFVRTHLRQLPVFVSKNGQVEVIAERQNYLLFDRMVAFHVQRGVTVPLSASEFYAGLEQRFSERDGMYFLAEQVAEYDKKRMTATEVMQLTLFVTDEASAIQWLKQQLTKKPQTFQDVHPQFMRQIGGWSKHELSLELRDLLEQNFLVYDGAGEVPSQIHAYLSTNYKDLRNLAKDDPLLRGDAADRWYVPDPNKAGDLEKLRERALLREFAEYRESKARKLKVFRLEAVRAGFKKAWGDRDYATILAVAEKIPDAVLQEDPKLLMWYDQALTRSGR